MCTAVCCQMGDFYFGRTLDYDISYGEEITVTPRDYPLRFCHTGTPEHHYAMIGMARVEDGFPLYFDAVNEAGLCAAGLNFPHSTVYQPAAPQGENVAQYEFIPWLLSRCANLQQAVQRLQTIRLTGTPFSPQLPAAPLHWLVADRTGAVTVEATRYGLQILPNPVGVLTNEPPFEQQMLRLSDYLQLSPAEPQNRFGPQLPLHLYSRGMGALGLPGDFSSPSRFVRACFVKEHSVPGRTEAEQVGQFFHLMDTVAQPRGSCRLANGGCEITRYTSCCNADRGIYYYTTYENRSITAVHLHRFGVDGSRLVRRPLARTERITLQE